MAFAEKIRPTVERIEASPESYMEAVSLMAYDDYTAAVELPSGMEPYRNANHLWGICQGLTELNFDLVVTSMQWVDALDIFTYDDEYAYQDYYLKT